MTKTGRPSIYTPEIAADICARMGSGESLRSICRDASMPCESSVYLWLTKHEEFSKNYAIAQKERASAMFEEMLAIGDDVEPEPSEVAKARLRVDTRKWALARMDSKRFGDKVQQEVSGPDGGPVVTRVDVSGLTDDQLRALATIRLSE